MHLVLTSNPLVMPYMLTSPAAHTWPLLRFPTMLTSPLSATENDVLAP